MKKVILLFPELFFSGFAVYWFLENFKASGTINYIALVVFILMALQLFLRNRIIGLASGVVLGLFSAYMILAVISEFNDFDQSDNERFTFLLIWVGLFVFSGLVAGTMLLKYALAKHSQSEGAVIAG